MPGAGGTRTYTFTGAAPGTATIELHYLRSWEEEPPADVFMLGVTVVDPDPAIECVKYDYCCETLCEPIGETSHYGEADPCDCDESFSTDPRECEPVGTTCEFVD